MLSDFIPGHAQAEVRAGQTLYGVLPGDPDHILKECGNVLSMNECLEVQQRSGALEETRGAFENSDRKGKETPVRASLTF